MKNIQSTGNKLGAVTYLLRPIDLYPLCLFCFIKHVRVCQGRAGRRGPWETRPARHLPPRFIIEFKSNTS